MTTPPPEVSDFGEEAGCINKLDITMMLGVDGMEFFGAVSQLEYHFRRELFDRLPHETPTQIGAIVRFFDGKRFIQRIVLQPELLATGEPSWPSWIEDEQLPEDSCRFSDSEIETLEMVAIAALR